MNDEAIARFIERSENKVWGKYRGIVEDRDDPEQLGRLRLRVPSLLGETVTGWAWPVSPYAGAGIGLFLVPGKGDLVWVEFAEGELEHPLWTGCGWARPGQESEIPDEAKGSYPDTQVLRTRSGNVIILDDAGGEEKIVIRARSGCEITFDPGRDLVTLRGKNVTVQADKVLIQSDAEQPQELATRTFVEQVFALHKHPSGTGPTGPPMPEPPNPRALTSVLKAE